MQYADENPFGLTDENLREENFNSSGVLASTSAEPGRNKNHKSSEDA
jgi:hypothetical protein